MENLRLFMAFRLLKFMSFCDFLPSVRKRHQKEIIVSSLLASSLRKKKVLNQMG